MYEANCNESECKTCYNANVFVKNPVRIGLESFRHHDEEQYGGTGACQWGEDEDYSVEGRDDNFLVDIDHRLKTNGWLYLLSIRKTSLWPNVRDGGLTWIISTFQHKKWLVSTQKKESVSYHGIFYIKNLINYSKFLISILIITLQFLMAVRDCLNTLQHNGYFT